MDIMIQKKRQLAEDKIITLDKLAQELKKEARKKINHTLSEIQHREALEESRKKMVFSLKRKCLID